MHVRSVDRAGYEWFTTDEGLTPGRYVLGHRRSSEPNVYLSDTIPGLIMEVGLLIQQAEDDGRESLASPGISEADRQRLEEEHMQGLPARLSETSAIWESNPGWVHKLEPL